MQLIHTIEEMRAFRRKSASIAFVPTMGNLHEGHLALVRAARKLADDVVVSIFVNRLQFGVGEDFEHYPRTLQEDCAKLEAEGVSLVFAPSEAELYPQPQNFQVEPPAIAMELCGAFRPGHFRGVATIVNKLFNIVQPDVSVFGNKDYQQLYVIRQMVQELNMPIRIVGVDTGRAADGLALSSRNGYLSVTERAEAPRLYQQLQQIAAAVEAGEQDLRPLCHAAARTLIDHGWTIDYIEVRNADTLAQVQPNDSHLIVIAAARLGTTRLIDNIDVKR